jgi:hypothetical protein
MSSKVFLEILVPDAIVLRATIEEKNIDVEVEEQFDECIIFLIDIFTKETSLSCYIITK